MRRIENNAQNFANTAILRQKRIITQNENLKPSEPKYKVLFKLTDCFYDALLDELEAWARSVTECEDNYDSREVELIFDFGDGLGGYARLEAELECEWVDESFDHAFGTWDDPHKHYAPTAVSVACVYDIVITDADGEDMVVSYDKERIDGMEIIL